MAHFEHWQREAHGELSLRLGDNEIRIAPLLDGWRLEGPNFSWVENSLEDLVGIWEFYQGYLERHQKRCKSRRVTISEDLGDGFELVADGHAGASFQVRIDHDGICVGRYDGFLNTPAATFVLGQDTIQGAEMLEPIARRRGFGDKMRDAAERVTGLTAVPHGRNYTPGSLSDAASKSWDRRSKARPVPGYGNDMGTHMRSRMMDLCRQRLRRMEEYSLDLRRALALGERTGLPLMIGYSKGIPVCGWVVAGNGLPIDPSGTVNDDRLKEKAVDFAYPGDAIKFKQMAFRKADATIKRDWRVSISRIHREYVDDMVMLLGSTKLSRLLETVKMPSAKQDRPNDLAPAAPRR